MSYYVETEILKIFFLHKKKNICSNVERGRIK